MKKSVTIQNATICEVTKVFKNKVDKAWQQVLSILFLRNLIKRDAT